MFLAETAGFVAAMLFAVHPIHTEAVSMFFDPQLLRTKKRRMQDN